MKMLNQNTISAINSARLFSSRQSYEVPALRPWQYVQMEYERVGLTPPAWIPDFDTLEDAQIWMCLDSCYNLRLKECAWRQAV